MAESYVGLDVHSKLTQFVIQDADGRVMTSGAVPTTPEGLRLLRSGQHGIAKGTRVALESGTMANYVAGLLEQLELEPVVVDAREVRVKAYRPRQKSDRRDAFEICDGLRRNQYRSIVYIPPASIQILRQTLSQRRHFVRVQTAEVNGVKHQLRASGLRRLSRSLQGELAWQRLLSQVEDAQLASRIEYHHQVWHIAGAQAKLLEDSLQEQSRFFEEDFQRLQTAPGVGPIVALTFIATYADVSRFPDAKHAASYGGLVPSTDQSADQDRHGRITKEGSGELRSMLCEAAHHACRKTNPLQPYFSSMCARQGYKIAIVALAHRLCRILFAMMRDKAEFDITKLNIEVGPFEQKIVRPYRLKRGAASRA